MNSIEAMIQAFKPSMGKAIKPKFGIVVSHVAGMALWSKETKRLNLIKARQKKNKRNKRRGRNDLH